VKHFPGQHVKAAWASRFVARMTTSHVFGLFWPQIRVLSLTTERLFTTVAVTYTTVSIFARGDGSKDNFVRFTTSSQAALISLAPEDGQDRNQEEQTILATHRGSDSEGTQLTSRRKVLNLVNTA